MTRNYLLGTRYGEEKKDSNRPKFSQLVRHDAGIIGDKSTSKVIANQTKVDPRTVERAGTFAKAINTIVTNTGISRKDILTGVIKGTMKDINALALLGPGTQQRVITLIKEKKESDVKDSIKKVEKEDRERVIREIEEKERQTKEIQRKEREEREKERLEKGGEETP